MKVKLGIEVNIIKTWKTGKEKKIIIAKCKSSEDKEKIMESKKKLGKELH